MDTCELYIEEPSLDIDYPCYIGEYQYRWDVPDPSIDGEGDIEGYHLYRCPKAEVIERGRPVCNVDELVRKVISGNFDREEIASDIDSELNSILHKRLSIDLRMGETLKALRRQGVQRLGYRTMGDFAVEHLSFSGRLASEMIHNFDVLSRLPLTKKAYLQCEIMKSALRHTARVMTPANEKEWISLAQTLSLNELIDEVRLELEDKKSCDDPTGAEAEDSGSCCNADITKYGTDIPSEESDEEGNGVLMHFNVNPKLALVWDFALSHFRDSEQHGGAVSDFVDALLGNFLSSVSRRPYGCKSNKRGSMEDISKTHSHANKKTVNCKVGKREVGNSAEGNSSAGEQKTETSKDREKVLENYAAIYLASRDSESPESRKWLFRDAPGSAGLRSDSAQLEYPIFYRCHMKADSDEKLLRLGDYEPPRRDEHGACENGSNRENMLIIFPASFGEIPGKARDTAERLIEYAQMRQALDVGMGRLLWAMRYRSLYRVFECGCIEEYAIQYCDLSKPLLYRLLRLGAGLERRGNIKDAFESGMLSKEQAALILKIADNKNEKAWIDYAAHVPTATLKEEVERCVRIVQYDCMAPGNYTILPGFRYISDERFDGLSDEIKEIIRTGAWYESPAPGILWPLEEDDEQDVMERDRRLEEPWKYFEDVDEMLIYEAEVRESKSRRLLCAGAAGRDKREQTGESPLCAGITDLDRPAQGSKSPLFAGSGANGCECQSHDDLHCNCLSVGRSGRTAGFDPKTLSKARDIVRMPEGADPAETLLLDILADEDDNPGSGGEKGVRRGRNDTMPIRFFLPAEMLEIWNFAALLYLERISDQNQRLVPGGQTPFFEENGVSPLSYGPQGFLITLLQEYILTERIHLKVARNYAILKIDRFRCQVPGCRCRRNLEVHHIIWRSKGGCDEHWNLITLCKAYHSYILHDLMALKIEGEAPDNLTFTFDPHPESNAEPFMICRRGRKESSSKS